MAAHCLLCECLSEAVRGNAEKSLAVAFALGHTLKPGEMVLNLCRAHVNLVNLASTAVDDREILPKPPPTKN